MPFLINLIIGLVLSLASTLLQQAFAPKDKNATGTRGSAQVGGKVPQYFLMGSDAEAGKLEYQSSWGEVDGVPNAYLTSVYSFGDLPITAMIGLYINGVRTNDPTGDAVDQGLPVPDYNDGEDHFWAKFYSGAQTTADAYLVDKFGSDADRPWTSDMVGRGVPYLITTALWSETLFTGFPSVVGEFQGIALYDPRKDTTAGGSGSHRWSNPSTWEFSDNSAVMIYNIERGIYYNEPGATTLGTKVWGGSSTQAQLPYAVWAAAMDACDDAVSLEAGGTEKQFRAGRRISLNERPADVIKELLIGSNSRISHASDGTVYILVGVPAVADGAFGDGDVLATEPLGSIPFPNLDSIINGATATYREPLQAWEDKETAPYYRSDLEALDDGRQQVQGLDLGTTFSGTQAQRVIKAVIEEGRRFKTHVVALPPAFAQYRPLQVLAWTDERFGYVGKLFLITARTREPFGNVVFGLQEVDPADHNWVPGTDEKPLSFSPVVPNRPTPQTVSGPDAVPVPGTLAFDAFWSSTSVAVDVNFVRVTYRLPSDDDSRVTIPVPKPDLLLGAARVPVPYKLANTPIEVQLEYIPGSGRAMVASAWMPVTIADVRFTPADFYPDLGDTLEVLNSGLEWLAASNKRVKDDLQSIVVRLQDQGDITSENFQQVRTSLTATRDFITADYELLVTTAVGVLDGQIVGITSRVETLEVAYVDPVTGNAALASGLDAVVVQINDSETGLVALGDLASSVQVQVNDVSANGTLRASVLASPGGGWSNVGLYAEASDGSVPSVAALLLQAKTDGDSRGLLVGQHWSVLDSLGNVYAMFDATGAYFDTARIQDATIGTAKIIDANITTAKIANAAITEAKIGTAAITTAKIGTAAITSAKIGDLEVTTIKVANNAITLAQSDTVSDGAIPGTTGKTATIVFTGVATGAIIQLASSLLITGAGGGANYTLTLYRNGTQIDFDTAGNITGESEDVSLKVSKNDIVPSGGTITYTAKVRSPFTPSAFHVSNDFNLTGILFQK